MQMPDGSARHSASDVIIVDARSNQRSIAGMSGRYTLESWRDAAGNQREFTCRVVKMSPQAIELAAPVTGTVGELAVVHFDKFGKFEGPVIRIGQRGFVMRIMATAEDRSKVAGKIAWIEDKNSPDGRRHERFVPFDARSTVSLTDGRTLRCEIIDYSIFGAAVFADIEPELGAALKVGQVIGQVVRQFGGGFAVEFPAVQSLRTLEDLLTRPGGEP